MALKLLENPPFSGCAGINCFSEAQEDPPHPINLLVGHVAHTQCPSRSHGINQGLNLKVGGAGSTSRGPGPSLCCSPTSFLVNGDRLYQNKKIPFHQDRNRRGREKDI